MAISLGDPLYERIAKPQEEVHEVVVGIAPAHVSKIEYPLNTAICEKNVICAEVGVKHSCAKEEVIRCSDIRLQKLSQCNAIPLF